MEIRGLQFDHCQLANGNVQYKISIYSIHLQNRLTIFIFVYAFQVFAKN